MHGNGPQVGNILVQAEEASTKIPPQSLDVCVAQTEGSIGFVLQQAIRNRLESIGSGGEVATILTEVEATTAAGHTFENTYAYFFRFDGDRVAFLERMRKVAGDGSS